MTHDFNGKAVLVTGAGGGIGRATAQAFAAAGARLMVTDVDVSAGEETAALAHAEGGEARFLRVDVTRETDVAAMVAATVAAYGRLDCAFNNAGIEIETSRITECDESVFDRIMAVNVKGLWLCLKHELKQMEAQGGGAIVNTASVAGLKGAPRLATYSASKHAVVGLTRSTAAEFARQNIRINAVCPGMIRTPMSERWANMDPAMPARMAAMHPVGRIGEPHEVATAVLWLCSADASFVTGIAHAVDGGFTAI
ncbi:SDR family oxidoreductase [Variovorax sp. JS1663]|uniref:SDR family oxidoreductase n=1 Tax=Variovorax sp. JS1663 TaxID=1851577 RepID=UPI000B3463F5|nr:SDR family oxidoreductase [Variovorax sp. JS1663]OUL99176.1 short-chain dehydrogenase [Variovorax sp. JS1663]